MVFIFFLGFCSSYAGGGWIAEPGKGNIQLGHDWKIQDDALRRDTEGDLYDALFHTMHRFRFAYLSTEVGVLKNLEASALFTYLWAEELMDSTAEDTSHHYNGLSDMWLGLKYQLWSGEYPAALAFSVRLPYLYQSASTVNGQNATDIPGLLNRDYELNFHLSHSLTDRYYASASTGFRLREGAPANQILFSIEGGGRLPFLDDRLFVKATFDGAASVGEPGKYTSHDRFPGFSLEVSEGKTNHFFDFNNATYIRPGVGLSFRILPEVDLSAGYSYILWGHSTVVYHDILVQLGYNF